jgi:hypothetical protein
MKEIVEIRWHGREGQGWFRRLLQPQNQRVIDGLQAEMDCRRARLLQGCDEG